MKSNLLIFICLFPLALCAQQNPKKQYSLFKPTPKDLMRDMETDRPDVTESPFTVDAGHFQLETDLFRFEKEYAEDSREQTSLFNQMNLKIGLTNSTAIQIGLQSYGILHETDLSNYEKNSTRGIGDVTFRIKQNLIGNDKGNFILAVLPYVKFPTSKFDEQSRYEGGLIVPMQFKLPHDWKLGTQIEGSRLKDQEDNGMYNELLQSLTLSHDIVKHCAGIAETFYTYDLKKHQWTNYLNAAVQIDILEDFKLDAGVNYGLQHDSQRSCFIGASFRL